MANEGLTNDSNKLILATGDATPRTIANHLASKLDRAGGDGSAVLVTPTGSTTPRTAAAVARSAEAAAGATPAKSYVAAFDSAVIAPGPTPATPGAMLVDEFVDLGPWGLTVAWFWSRSVLVIEKPDGAGGWTPTTDSDPEGYEVQIQNPYDSIAAFGAWGAGGRTRGFERMNWSQVFGGDINPDRGDAQYLMTSALRRGMFTRGRVGLRRSDRVYTAEEQARIDALGYRARFVVLVPNAVLWEREVSLDAADGTVVLDESIDLAALGLTVNHRRSAYVFEFRRGGRTIWTRIEKQTPTTGDVEDLTAYPPAPPVNIDIGVMFPIVNVRDASEGMGESTEPHASGPGLFGDGLSASLGDGARKPTPARGTWLAGNIGTGSQWTYEHIWIRVTRDGALDPTYDGGSAGELETPPDAALGTTLRVRILGAPDGLEYEYPYVNEVAENGYHRLPLATAPNTDPTIMFMPNELWVDFDGALRFGSLYVQASP